MIKNIKNLNLKDACIIEPNVFHDHRGLFAETFSSKELYTVMDIEWVQDNLAHNKKKGTFRGFHYQLPPHTQAKLVRVVKGEILDILIDLRGKSPTYGEYASVMLTAETMNMVYVPKGFAHGYITLVDDTVVEYKVSEYYNEESSKTLSYIDPLVGFSMPYTYTSLTIGFKDKHVELFNVEENPFKDWE